MWELEVNEISVLWGIDIRPIFETLLKYLITINFQLSHIYVSFITMAVYLQQIQ